MSEQVNNAVIGLQFDQASVALFPARGSGQQQHPGLLGARSSYTVLTPQQQQGAQIKAPGQVIG